MRTTQQIADLQVGKGRRTVRADILFQHAGVTNVVDVVAGRLRQRAVLAVTGNRAHHQLRVALFQRAPAEAELVHHAGAEALDDDVGALDHAEEFVPLGGSFQVEPEELLAAIDGDEKLRHFMPHVAHGACVVADAGVFDLHHCSAHVGQMHGGDRAGQQAGEVEYADAAQRLVDRLGHGSFFRG